MKNVKKKFLKCLTLALCPWLACSSPRGPARPDGAVIEATSPEARPCEERWRALARWREAVLAQPSTDEGPVLQVKLAEVALEGPDVDDMSISIVVTPSETFVEGDAVADVEKTLARFAVRLQKLHQPFSITVMVEPTAPWARVVTVLHAATAAGVVEADFAFRRAGVPAAPGPSAIDAELADARFAAREARLTRGEALPPMSLVLWPSLERAVARCKIFENLDASDSESRMRRFGAWFPSAPAATDCKCSLDEPSLRAVIWAMNRPSVQVVVRVRLGGADATPLALPSAQPWSKSSRALVALRDRGVKASVAP